MEKEIWLPVKGFECFYEVSNRGYVKALAVSRKHGTYRRTRSEKILNKNTKPGKYSKVHLVNEKGQKREVRVAVLVAEHFIPNPDNKPYVCHKNDVKLDNDVQNLYWGTAKSNNYDKVINGHAGKKLTAQDVKYIRHMLSTENRRGLHAALAKQFNVHPSIISSVRDKKIWTHV